MIVFNGLNVACGKLCIPKVAECFDMVYEGPKPLLGDLDGAAV